MLHSYQKFLVMIYIIVLVSIQVTAFGTLKNSPNIFRERVLRSIAKPCKDASYYGIKSHTALCMGARNAAWARGDLGDKDFFDDDDGNEVNSEEEGNNPISKELSSKDKKKKFKLEAETVFFEGPPSATEILFPALSILTVIGIVPFISAVSRQFWVKYKFTSRRVSIQSGFGGNTQTEIIYPDVEEIRFVYRAFGAAGDMVLFLRDGAKVELRHVPRFEEIYEYVLSKCDDECKAKSMKLVKKDE